MITQNTALRHNPWFQIRTSLNLCQMQVPKCWQLNFLPILYYSQTPPAPKKHTCQMVSQLAMVTEDTQFVTTGENGLRKQTLKWSEVANNLASQLPIAINGSDDTKTKSRNITNKTSPCIPVEDKSWQLLWVNDFCFSPLNVFVIYLFK